MHVSSAETDSSTRGTALAALDRMHALEVEGELLACDRPTIPVPEPRESGVRLKVARVAYGAATVDVVVCDLSRDPRSEDYAPVPDTLRSPHRSGFFPARCAAPERYGAYAVLVQNERPPSTSIVRALK
jgi:hypothetical protein